MRSSVSAFQDQFPWHARASAIAILALSQQKDAVQQYFNILESRGESRVKKMAFSCMECMRRFSQIVLIIINVIVVVSLTRSKLNHCERMEYWASFLCASISMNSAAPYIGADFVTLILYSM